MDVTDVWVANDEGTEIIRARDIASAAWTMTEMSRCG